MLQGITIKNANLSRKFGYGWGTTPTGRDAFSIQSPAKPDYTGTVKGILEERGDDRSYRAYGSSRATNYSSHQWFYDGKPIVNIWKTGYIKQAEDIPDYSDGDKFKYEAWRRLNDEHHWKNDVIGEAFFSFREDDLNLLTGDVTIQVRSPETQVLPKRPSTPHKGTVKMGIVHHKKRRLSPSPVIKGIK
jgi:hypothetical protein